MLCATAVGPPHYRQCVHTCLCIPHIGRTRVMLFLAPKTCSPHLFNRIASSLLFFLLFFCSNSFFSSNMCNDGRVCIFWPCTRHNIPPCTFSIKRSLQIVCSITCNIKQPFRPPARPRRPSTSFLVNLRTLLGSSQVGSKLPLYIYADVCNIC